MNTNITHVAKALRACTFTELREIAQQIHGPLCDLPVLKDEPRYGGRNRELVLSVQPLQIADVLADWAADPGDPAPSADTSDA